MHWAASGFVLLPLVMLGSLQVKYWEFFCECCCDPKGAALKQDRDFHLALPQRASGHSQKGLEQNFPLGCSSCGDIEYEGSPSTLGGALLDSLWLRVAVLVL